MNLAERSRRPRPRTGGANPLDFKNRETDRERANKQSFHTNMDNDEDVFKDLLSSVKQDMPKPKKPVTKKQDDFEAILEEENKRLAMEIESDELNFKSEADSSKPKDISKISKEEDENLDDVLDLLEIGGGGAKSKPKDTQKEIQNKKEEDKKKQRKAKLFFGGEEEERKETRDTSNDKPKSLLDKSKRQELNREKIQEKSEERRVVDLKEKAKMSDLDRYNFDDTQESLFDRNNKKEREREENYSSAVMNEETRVLKSQVEVLTKRIEQLMKDKEENLKQESEKQKKEIEKMNLVHTQEIDNLKSNQEYNKSQMQRMFEEEKTRINSLHEQEMTTTTRNQEFKLDNLKKYYETQLDGYSGLKKTNQDITSMSDFVKNNLDELKVVVQEIKYFKSKDENEDQTKFEQKNEVLKRFEISLADRVRDLERQREIVDNMRKVMEEQMASNNEFFTQERMRLKEKQLDMEAIRSKYEEVISTQKDQILREQVKVKQLEDELQYKQAELKRKSDSHEDTMKRETTEIKQRRDELVKYKDSLEEMLATERRKIDDERYVLKKDREDILKEKLNIEEISNEIRREREAVEVERKNFENERSRWEEERDQVTRIAITMQQKSQYISERDAEIQQERAELENLKFELERDKSKLKTDLHTLEQKKQDLNMKTKAFENMRYNISKEMNSFEEEKATFFKSNTFTPATLGSSFSKTGQFVKESLIDKELLKRDVSPVRIKTSRDNYDIPSSRFNLTNYLQDLDRKQNNMSNSEYLLKENQDLIKNKFEISGYDPILRNEAKSLYNSVNFPSTSSIGYSARNNKNTPITMKSIEVISANDLNSEDKRKD